jgi:hypothetical protein
MGKNNKHRLFFGLALLSALLVVTACGGGGSDDSPRLRTTQILSDNGVDGDISFTEPNTYVITSATVSGNVFVGIDPGTDPELRAFLHFPLGGSNGVPIDASIESATLEVFVNGMTLPVSENIMPLLIDLIDYEPPIVASDYSRSLQPALLTLPFDFFLSDVGRFVRIDVTALMQQAQTERLPYFQLRLLLDLAVSEGLMEIDDSDADYAPLLTVEYSD